MKTLILIVTLSTLSLSQVSKTYFKLNLPLDTASFYRMNSTVSKSTIDTSDTRFTRIEYFQQNGELYGWDINAQHEMTDKGYDVWDRYDLPITYEKRFDQYGTPDSMYFPGVGQFAGTLRAPVLVADSLYTQKLVCPIANIDSVEGDVKFGGSVGSYYGTTYLRFENFVGALPGYPSDRLSTIKTTDDAIRFSTDNYFLGAFVLENNRNASIYLFDTSTTGYTTNIRAKGASYIGGSLRINGPDTAFTYNSGYGNFEIGQNLRTTDSIKAAKFVARDSLVVSNSNGLFRILTYLFAGAYKSFFIGFEDIDWVDATAVGSRLLTYFKGQTCFIDGGVYVNRADTLINYKFAVRGNALIDSNLVFGTTYVGTPIRTIYTQDSARDLTVGDTMWIYGTYPNSDHAFIFSANYFNGKKRWIFKFNVNASNTQMYIKYYSVSGGYWIDQSMESNPSGKIEYTLSRHSSTEYSLLNSANEQYSYSFPGTTMSDQLQFKIYAITSSGGSGDVKYATIEIQEVQ